VSNRARLTRTHFLGDDGVNGWGWRLEDNYCRNYTDHLEEQEVPEDPLKLLARAAIEATDEERDMFEGHLTAGNGLYINGSWFESAEIAPVLDKALNEEHGHG